MKAKVIRIHQADVLSPTILQAGRSSTYPDRFRSHPAPLFLTNTPVPQTSLRPSPPHLLICNYTSNLSLNVPQITMIWLKLKQVLRRLTGKKQTSNTSQPYTTTSTLTPTANPPSLTRLSPEASPTAPNLSTVDSTSHSITSSGQTSATRSSTIASLTATITTAASLSDSGETRENTDVSGYVHILAQ